MCFHGVTTTIKGRREWAIAAVLIKNGEETCCVGFFNTCYIQKEKELERVSTQVVMVLSDYMNKTHISTDCEIFHGIQRGRKKFLNRNEEKAKKRPTSDIDGSIK